ncbi:hypothetical protein [uncultured Phenylobacterium sp.]|uniref:hypothetical protein n=1 Tax=uncultured Phenylobacterium sp. TaxID=349273 RepID=UPI0025DEDE2C|nr:hypothetical protein [uncultured Phenylobacterium sp.]
MTTLILSRLRRRYPTVARDLLAPLLALIDEAERTFGGDLEKFHILLAVALRSAEHPDWTKGGAMPETTGDLPSLWTNVHSIALSVGIPEETVRRKVRALIAQGWLERTDHSLRYTRKAAEEMGPIRDALTRLAVSNYLTVAAVLADEG